MLRNTFEPRSRSLTQKLDAQVKRFILQAFVIISQYYVGE